MDGTESSELLQKRLYFLVEQLQSMAQELPTKYQMRVPYELLSSLAHSLLNGTIFEIVKGLMEIQHVTEQHLYQQRLQFISRQKLEEQQILDRADINAEKKVELLNQMKETHQKALKEFDMSLMIQLDEKVTDQQQTLEQAGIPGFYKTSNSLEIKVQIYLLDFILRLSNMELPS